MSRPAGPLAALGRLGWRRLADPWRTAARAQLREEESAFALAALGVRLPLGPGQAPPADPAAAAEVLAAGLSAALGREPATRCRLAWRGPVPRVVAHEPADILLALDDGIELRLDERVPAPGLPARLRSALDAAVLAELPAIAELPASRRGAPLERRVAAALARSAPRGERRAGRAYLRRLLAATVLTVEAPAGDPVGLPSQHPVLPLAHNLLEVRARLRPGLTHADLWMRAIHVAIDGAPVQDVLERLKESWGAEPLRLPGPAALRGGEERVCSQHRGDEAVLATLGLLDLARVFELRARAAAAGVELPFAGAVAWALAAHPDLAGEAIAIPVDLPANDHRSRSLSLAVVRPADFGTSGLAAYAAAFAAELAAARGETNAVAGALRAAALVPTPLLARVPVTPGRRAAVAGTAGVSVAARSDVFVPAINDAYRWYLGLGNAAIPAAGGGTVGAVVLKCRRADLPRIARAVDEALRPEAVPSR